MALPGGGVGDKPATWQAQPGAPASLTDPSHRRGARTYLAYRADFGSLEHEKSMTCGILGPRIVKVGLAANRIRRWASDLEVLFHKIIFLSDFFICLRKILLTSR